MLTKIEKTTRLAKNANIAILASSADNFKSELLTDVEITYIKQQKKKNNICSFSFNRLKHWIFVRFINADKTGHFRLEECRVMGDTLQKKLNGLKIESLVLQAEGSEAEELISLAEGIALGNYQFIKYFKDSYKKANSLKKLSITDERITRRDINKLNIF